MFRRISLSKGSNRRVPFWERQLPQCRPGPAINARNALNKIKLRRIWTAPIVRPAAM
jgi:hypothetical protein